MQFTRSLLVAAVAILSAAANVSAQEPSEDECFLTCDGGETCLGRDQVHDTYADCEDGADEECLLCRDESACFLKEDVNPDYPICEDASDVTDYAVGICNTGRACNDDGVEVNSPSTFASIVWAEGDCPDAADQR